MYIFYLLAPASFFQTQLRSKYLSFSVVLQEVIYRVFIKNPKNSFNYSVYLKPLTYLSWFCVIIFLVLVPITIYMTNNLKISLIESYEITYMALFGIGSSYNPSSCINRLVFCRQVYKYLNYIEWVNKIGTPYCSKGVLILLTHLVDV